MSRQTPIRAAFLKAAYWVGDRVFSTGHVMNQHGDNPDLSPALNWLNTPHVKTTFAAAAVVAVADIATHAVTPNYIIGTMGEQLLTGGAAAAAMSSYQYVFNRGLHPLFFPALKYFVSREPERNIIDPALLHDVKQRASAGIFMASVPISVATIDILQTRSLSEISALVPLAAVTFGMNKLYMQHRIKTRAWSVTADKPPRRRKLRKVKEDWGLNLGGLQPGFQPVRVRYARRVAAAKPRTHSATAATRPGLG
jgi:hypothetical protein